jgi:hypothetical protein
MKSLSGYIAEAAGKNTHMTHIEDLILDGGVKGARQAINALRSLRDMLSGNSKKSVDITVKWDGAPAVFAGEDPRDGSFFVAKKGIFNANPKIYKSHEDIKADTSGDLTKKLILAFDELSKLGIKGVIQGDFMFDNSDLKKETIDGKSFLVFHPNTIAYTVPADSTLAKEIRAAKIGIVWHTTYKGSTFESMKASYGVDVSKLKTSKNVWSQDAMLRDLTNMTMSKKETAIVNEHLSKAGFLFNKIAGSTLRQLEANQQLAGLIETFNNSYVRKGQVIGDTNRHVNALIKWIGARYQKEIDKRKTEKGKAAQQKKLDDILSFFSTRNKTSLKYMFDLQKAIVLAKLRLINSLNKLSKVRTFVKTNNGYKVTGEEGYVAIDKIGGDAVKIVDRMEFSYNNFSNSILKGWDKPGK